MSKYKFIITVHGISFKNPGSFSTISERFRNIQISTNTERNLELLVEKDDFRRSPDLVKKEAEFEANDLVDRLSLCDNHRITSLKYQGYYDRSGKFIPHQEKPRRKFALTAIIEYPEDYYSQSFNKAILKSKKYPGVLRIYRTALGITDKISQYLIFYGLLHILKGDKQSEVEEYIKEEITDILIVSGKKGDKTIITNIRNKIAHPPENLEMEKLNDEVNDYIHVLEELVRKILREE
ncbi:MAG: hypothetical protein IH592_13850 [Bacteroidales bacterium]|nr:hypothetical protein [Bacteroidales bacterium]